MSPIKMNDIAFLTSNKRKAYDFEEKGFSVKEFHTEISEILSPDVEEVVLYKARDTHLINIMVEDTSFEVVGAPFYGTEIKHVYDSIKDDSHYHGHEAVWRVSICLRLQDAYYISTGELKGEVRYPAVEHGYHFERFFSVKTQEGWRNFGEVPPEEKERFKNPRFKAMDQIVTALNTNDFSGLKKIKAKHLKEWDGGFQEEGVVRESVRNHLLKCA